MDSSGEERLLGRTELSPLEILIRETAQNSWDARLENCRPAYGINLRRADGQLQDDLNRLLPFPLRGSSASFSAPSPFVLEIFDRRTSGLDGPVSLQPTPDDVPRNYEDLILKVGVPRDDGRGGGTYGFGKTAAYAFSRRGTVLYWTRCRNENREMEHRLIASAFRDSYVDNGVQYTGRHWWGRRNGEMILPVIGPDAAALGAHLFDRGFSDDETGTSMLILDPDLSTRSLGGASPDEGELDLSDATDAELFAAKARSAIRIHLWPKLISRPEHHLSPMEITLEVERSEQDLVAEPMGTLALWGAGLNAIRAERESSERVTTPQGLPVRVTPITRNRRTLGHLAIVERVLALEANSERDDLDPRFSTGIRRIALMRGQPELIVSTVDWFDQTPLEGIEWLAVYKAADEWDAIYARTEPPAHDAWIASSGGEEGLVVRATRNKVISAIRDSLYAPPVRTDDDNQTLRISELSRRFGSILPQPTAQGTGGASSPRGGLRRARTARTDVVEAAPPRLVATMEDGRQRQRVDFIVRSASRLSQVSIGVSVIGDEGAHELLPSAGLDLTWFGAENASGAQASVLSDHPAGVEFTAVGRRALRIDIGAEAADAPS